MSTRTLLWAGLVGPPLFCAAFLIEGAVQPGYDAWRDQVSLLSLGSQGWVQIANFIVFGLLMLAFSIGVRRMLAPGRASVAGPLLFGLFGVGLVLAGIFVTDAQSSGGEPVIVTSHGLVYLGNAQVVTTHGLVHVLAAFMGFGSLTLACFVLARRFVAEGGWGGFATYSLACGIAVAVLFVATNSAPYGWQGLVQRASIAVGWLWIWLVAWRLLPRRH